MVTSWFQSTSVIADGRIYIILRRYYAIGPFQSTSVIADGRIGRPLDERSRRGGFNPRPSLLTDESDPANWIWSSILEFQSTSVIADGRMEQGAEPAVKLEEFQSTSVIADGRIHCRSSPASQECGFNPRPSLLTDESPAYWLLYHLQTRFNPRPSLLTDECALF